MNEIARIAHAMLRAARHGLAMLLAAIAPLWQAHAAGAPPADGAPSAASSAATAARCPPSARPPSADAMQAGLRKARDRGFLWRVTRDGHSSYLYGTVHVATQDTMYPGPRIVAALRDADTVALELDLLDPDVQRRFVEAMAASPRPALPEPLQRRLQRRADAECVPLELLAGMSPMMQIATVSALAARRDGIDPAYGIDMLIDSIAHGGGKPVVSLETPELQLQTLGGDEEQSLAEMAASGLDEIESGRARTMMKRLVRIWAESDRAELERYETWCDCLKTDADRRALARMLDDRNPALAEGIDALHRRGQQVFAAVGSLHMIGPQGLPALLERQGYRVERLVPER